MGGNSKNLTVIFILSLVKLCPSPHHCQQKTAAPDVSLKRSILINAAITAAFSVPLESWMRNGPGCMAAWQWRTWAAEGASAFCIRQVGRPAEAHVTGVEFAEWRLQSMLFCAPTEISTRHAHTGVEDCPYQSILMKKPYRISYRWEHQDKISTKFLWTKSTRNENCWRELGSKDPFCGLTTGIFSTPTVSTVTNSAHQS